MAASDSIDKICTLCNKELATDKVVNVSLGLKTLINHSTILKDNLWKKWIDRSSIKLHENCRKRYTALRLIRRSRKQSSSDSEDSQTNDDRKFSFERHCIICGKTCSEADEQLKSPPKKRKIHYVQKDSTFVKTLFTALKARNDAHSKKIKKRVSDNVNLAEVSAKYHATCYTSYLHKKPQPPGRPKNPAYESTLEKICEHFKSSSDCQFVLEDLLVDMVEDEVPSLMHLKNMLTNRYGDDIVFSSRPKQKTIITFRSRGEDKIFLNHFYTHVTEDDDTKRREIIEKTANCIRDDIEMLHQNSQNNAHASDDNESIETEIPESLWILLNAIIGKDEEDRTPDDDRETMDIANAIMLVAKK